MSQDGERVRGKAAKRHCDSSITWPKARQERPWTNVAPLVRRAVKLDEVQFYAERAGASFPAFDADERPGSRVAIAAAAEDERGWNGPSGLLRVRRRHADAHEVATQKPVGRASRTPITFGESAVTPVTRVACEAAAVQRSSTKLSRGRQTQAKKKPCCFQASFSPTCAAAGSVPAVARSRQDWQAPLRHSESTCWP